MSVFSLAGGSVLGLFENVDLSSAMTAVETKPVTRVYGRAQGTKKEWKVTTGLMQNNGLATKRIDHLSVSVFSLDAADMLGQFSSGKISMTATVVTKPEAGAVWKTKQVTGKKLMFDGEFTVPTGAASALLTMLKSGTIADHSVAAVMTIDGVTYEFPGVYTNLSLKAEREGLYVVSATLEGESPDTGAFPTTPTGTTSLIEKALNSRAAVAVALTTQTTNGNAFSGNAVISGLDINVSDEDIIKYSMTFEGTGALS